MLCVRRGLANHSVQAYMINASLLAIATMPMHTEYEIQIAAMGKLGPNLYVSMGKLAAYYCPQSCLHFRGSSCKPMRAA